MPPIKPKKKGLALAQSIAAPAVPHLLLPCGCRVEQHNHHGIIVTYCPRHVTFTFSPRHNGTDVFYFVTEDKQP